MKTKLPIILFFVVLFSVFATRAFAISIYTVPLTTLEKADETSRKDKKAITPDMFSVNIIDHTLTVSTALGAPFALQITNEQSHKRVLSKPLCTGGTYELPEPGVYSMTITYRNVSLFGNIYVRLTSQEAADIVMKAFEGRDVEIFMSNRIYPKGDSICTMVDDEKFYTDAETWVAFVDLNPGANWAHPCQYIFIDPFSGDTIVKNQTWQPLDFEHEYMPYLRKGGVKDKAIVKSVRDAFFIADSLYKDQVVEIWISKSCYSSSETIELYYGDITAPVLPSKYWLAFVDLHPLENWGHPCEYVFIDAYTKKTTIVQSTRYPLHVTDKFLFMRMDKLLNSSNVASSQNVQCPQHMLFHSEANFKSERLLSNLGPNNKWAILISGGKDPRYNYHRYWEDCSAMYKTLRSHGYLASHIFVAISDGLSSSPDYILSGNPYDPNSTIIYANSSLDLDDDNIADVGYSASRDDISKMFGDIQYYMNDGDEVFIFTTDHGEMIDNHATLELWNNERMTDVEFVQKINALKAGRVNILMAQCYSGGFIDDVQTLDSSFVITTACAAEQQSAALGNGEYDEFVYRWLTAINGTSPDLLVTGNADDNSDGYISMQEAYTYACKHDNKHESPQIYSETRCLRYDLTLTDLLDYCTNSDVAIDTCDIYIKDNAGDFGHQPNLSTEKSWISPDIWLEDWLGRQALFPIIGHTYRIRTRIHNRGEEDYAGGHVVYFHWSKALIGGLWPDSWINTTNMYSCGNSSVPRGGEINETGILIPPIPAGESRIVSAEWTVPNYDYSLCSDFEEDVDDLWHYCLLARIVDPNDPNSNDLAEQPLSPFILGSNKVASRNLSFMRQPPIVQEQYAASIVGIDVPEHQAYHLYCDVISPSSIGTGSLFITINQDLYDNWYGTWDGCVDLEDDGQFEITNNHAEINYLDIASGTVYPFKVELDTTTISPYQDVIFDISLVNSSNDSIVGGQRFIYWSELSSNGAQQKPIRKEQNSNDFTITCFPNPANTTLYVRTGFDAERTAIRIYNMQGQCLITSTDTRIDVAPLPFGIYWLTVESEFGMHQTKFLKQ